MNYYLLEYFEILISPGQKGLTGFTLDVCFWGVGSGKRIFVISLYPVNVYDKYFVEDVRRLLALLLH